MDKPLITSVLGVALILGIKALACLGNPLFPSSKVLYLLVQSEEHLFIYQRIRATAEI